MRIHVYRDRNVGVQVYRRLKEYGIVQARPGVDPRRDINVMVDDPYVTSRAAERLST